MSWFDESLRWYLTSLAAGVAFAPLSRWLFRRLPGAGAWLVRPVGLLATVWPVWLLASLTPVPYATWLLWAVVAVGAAVSWGLAIRAGTIDRGWLRSLVLAELVFLAAFAVGIAFRGYVPKIAGTEQPMDVGFLASSIRATDMPPRDEWFAGEPINYYYLGYLINGSIARMAGLPSWVGYNLALISTFATAVVATAGLAGAVARRLVGPRLAILAGAAGAFLIMVAGNMRAPIEFLKDPSYVWNTFWFQNVGWQSSRVIVDAGWRQEETITEFPSFSFLLGDLHPHVTTLPFTILTLALAVSQFLRARDDWRRDDWRCWAELGVVGVAVGSLYPMNSWDFPTYAGAIAVAVIAVFGVSRATVEQGLGLGLASVVAWSPFWVGFVPFAGGSTEGIPNIPVYRTIAENVAGYTGPWTTAGEFLTVLGMPWAITMLFLVVETLADPRHPTEADVVDGEGDNPNPVPERAVRGGLIALAVVAALVAIALPAPVILLSGIPVALAVRLIARRWGEGATAGTVALVLLAVGFGITLLTELFYVRDTFDGRYNTLFKVYYQVWTLLGIGCAVAVVLLWQRAERSPTLRVAVAAGLVAVVALGSAYPVLSGKTIIPMRDAGQVELGWQGLDGLAGHGEAGAGGVEPILSGHSPDDVAAIRWLNDHGREGDVLLEAPGCQYQISYALPTGRFAAFTGIPTVIGWDGAERQWRGGQPDLEGQIEPRAGDASAMYEDPDPSTNPLFDQYGITLMVVGDIERYGAGSECEKAGPYEAVSRAEYPGPAWDLEFEAGETRIYRRATS